MDAYMYKASFLCKDCAEKVKGMLEYKYAGVPESEFDSDEYPKGPYPDGGGEADCPQHCDTCGLFLENPLTGDGENYVYEALADRDGDPAVLSEWEDFYSYLIDWE
jgi:hypothetical protein